MRNYRILFTKDGLGRYISHLDLVRTMQRAFLRADLPIRHTEGFNPHPYMNFALPLSIGTDSVCELMDFGLMDDTLSPQQVTERLNRSLPSGITVLKTYEPKTKLNQLKWLLVEGILEYDNPIEGVSDKLAGLFARKELVIEKKTKKGIAPTDIRPAILKTEFSEPAPGKVRVLALLSAAEPSLSPHHMMDAIEQLSDLAPDFAHFTRREIFDSSMKVFR